MPVGRYRARENSNCPRERRRKSRVYGRAKASSVARRAEHRKDFNRRDRRAFAENAENCRRVRPQRNAKTAKDDRAAECTTKHAPLCDLCETSANSAVITFTAGAKQTVGSKTICNRRHRRVLAGDAEIAEPSQSTAEKRWYSRGVFREFFSASGDMPVTGS